MGHKSILHVSASSEESSRVMTLYASPVPTGGDNQAGSGGGWRALIILLWGQGDERGGSRPRLVLVPCARVGGGRACMRASDAAAARWLPYRVAVPHQATVPPGHRQGGGEFLKGDAGKLPSIFLKATRGVWISADLQHLEVSGGPQRLLGLGYKF